MLADISISELDGRDDEVLSVDKLTTGVSSLGWLLMRELFESGKL
jgi:hypothetical protein